jgi:hypothetical protein
LSEGTAETLPLGVVVGDSALGRICVNSSLIISGLAVLLAETMAAEAPDQARAFGTPEEAVKALSVAASAKDDAALRAISGPDYEQIKDPDPAQAAGDLAAFEAAITQTNRIVLRSDTNCIVEIGTNPWPFPIPLVKHGGQKPPCLA